MDAILAGWVDRLRAATAARQALRIRAGGSKDFYGNATTGELFDPREWAGIEAYDPSELVITVRAGTPLRDVEAALAAEGQMLAFEPPHFGPQATVGGCVAAGLAGPRRASAGVTQGSLRDYVLGARLLDGQGRLLRFGGTVMKNVAGYDVARVLAGSLGILGLIVDVSLKVLPRPRAELTLQFDCEQSRALDLLNDWGGRALPLSASCWVDGCLWLRLAGAEPALRAARLQLGGAEVGANQAAGFWGALREQQLPWFSGGLALWRIAVPSTAAVLDLPGAALVEWGGGLRWLRSDLPATAIRAQAQALGGHATLFRGGDRSQPVFTPLSPALLAIHRRLKAEFDPAGIFNRGRLVPDL
jgi:glycolate oxidase FAD binding subunit